MHFSTFNEVCTHMESFINLERQNSGYSVRLYRLDRMRLLLKHLGNPEKEYKTIHIAGSKGKGSTASFLAKGVESLGYRVGLYTSPHLMDYRERFTLAGTFFSEEALVEAGNLLFSKLQNFCFTDEWGSSDPTTFELFTAFAYLLFSLQKCEWAIIETGLGGRLDATNTLTPQAVVITPIEKEHTAILGDTIAKIALEKAKIIVKGVPTFISNQPQEAKEVFITETKEQESPLFDLSEEVSAIEHQTTLQGEKVSIRWKSEKESSLLLSLKGEVQGENSALALFVLKKLGLYKKGVTERALEEAYIPGRMELISTKVPIIIDGAHTVESLRHLFNSFNQLYPNQQNILIFGSLEDKDHLSMIHLLLPTFHTIIISRPGTFKKSNPQALYQLVQSEAEKSNISVELYLEEEADRALSLAQSLYKEGSAILCTGSFYLAAEIVKAYQRGHYVTKLA